MCIVCRKAETEINLRFVEEKRGDREMVGVFMNKNVCSVLRMYNKSYAIKLSLKLSRCFVFPF